MSEKKVFDVHIEQGHMHNAKVVLRGEAGLGNDPTILPGDVVFVLEMRPHAVFQRVSHDLIMEKVCSRPVAQRPWQLRPRVVWM